MGAGEALVHRILIIDDEEEVREILRRALEKDGFAVDEAADGREGLRRFRQGGADLVIVDLFMPYKEGMETILEIRETAPDVRTIAISGGGLSGEMEFLEHAETFGASRTFTKPLDLAVLVKAVHELLGAEAAST